MKEQTKHLLPNAAKVYCVIALIVVLGILIVKEIADDRRLKRDLEADPYYQSVFRAADAINLVRDRSFAELNHDERYKVVMKCAEAYALVTLPSAQPPDRNDPSFIKYLSRLNIVAKTEPMTANVKQVDQAFEVIRDFLWSRYGEY